MASSRVGSKKEESVDSERHQRPSREDQPKQEALTPQVSGRQANRRSAIPDDNGDDDPSSYDEESDDSSISSESVPEQYDRPTTVVRNRGRINTPRSSTPRSNTSRYDKKNSTKVDLKVKLSDYPSFSGNASQWYHLREEYEALIQAQGFECSKR